MRLYTASSWRCERYPAIVDALRGLGHEVYDFRTDGAFAWQDIEPEWNQEAISPGHFQSMVCHPLAVKAHSTDMAALDDCEAVVLILPCGTSAHWEADYAALRAQKERIERQLAICIKWLGEAEVEAAEAANFRREAERLASLATERLERLTEREEELLMIALALKNEGVGDDEPEQVTPERGVEILIERCKAAEKEVDRLDGELKAVFGAGSVEDLSERERRG